MVEVMEYARRNIAQVTIYIREPFAEEILISEQITPIAFMSDVGGLMGLFMGCSFVSLAEIAYHCFLCIILLFAKKRALFKKSQAQKRQRKRTSLASSHPQLESPPGKYLEILKMKRDLLLKRCLEKFD